MNSTTQNPKKLVWLLFAALALNMSAWFQADDSSLELASDSETDYTDCTLTGGNTVRRDRKTGKHEQTSVDVKFQITFAQSKCRSKDDWSPNPQQKDGYVLEIRATDANCDRCDLGSRVRRFQVTDAAGLKAYAQDLMQTLADQIAKSAKKGEEAKKKEELDAKKLAEYKKLAKKCEAKVTTDKETGKETWEKLTAKKDIIDCKMTDLDKQDDATQKKWFREISTYIKNLYRTKPDEASDLITKLLENADGLDNRSITAMLNLMQTFQGEQSLLMDFRQRLGQTRNQQERNILFQQLRQRLQQDMSGPSQAALYSSLDMRTGRPSSDMSSMVNDWNTLLMDSASAIYRGNNSYNGYYGTNGDRRSTVPTGTRGTPYSGRPPQFGNGYRPGI